MLLGISFRLFEVVYYYLFINENIYIKNFMHVPSLTFQFRKHIYFVMSMTVDFVIIVFVW